MNELRVRASGIQHFALGSLVVLISLIGTPVIYRALRTPNRVNLIVGLIGLLLFAMLPFLYLLRLRRVDREGASLNSGRRYLWRDLKDIKVIRQLRYGQVVGYRFVFTFGGERRGKLRFATAGLAEPLEVIGFIERVLGRRLLPGGAG
jgi:hypothetical protein